MHSLVSSSISSSPFMSHPEPYPYMKAHFIPCWLAVRNRHASWKRFRRSVCSVRWKKARHWGPQQKRCQFPGLAEVKFRGGGRRRGTCSRCLRVVALRAGKKASTVASVGAPARSAKWVSPSVGRAPEASARSSRELPALRPRPPWWRVVPVTTVAKILVHYPYELARRWPLQL